MFKRSMSMILAVVMIIGMLPLSVFADEGAVCSCTAPCAAEAVSAECPVCAADAAACAAEGGEAIQEPSEEAPAAETEEPSQEAPAVEPGEETAQAVIEEPVQLQAEEPTPSIPAGHVSSVLFEGAMAADWMPSINSGELEYAGQLWLYISSVTDESGNPVAYRTNYNNPSDPANNVVLDHAAGEGYAVQVTAEEGSSHSWGITEAGFASIIVTCKLVYIHEDMSHLPAKGTQENPKVITDVAFTSVSLTEETASGYYYSYTSTLNGYVAYSAGEAFGLTLTNQTTGATDSLWKTNREGKTIQSGPCYVKVSTGDVVLIKVSSRSGNAVSGSIFGANVYGSSTEGQGINLGGDNYIATLTPGETINFTCRFQGRKVYVYGEGITVSNGGTTYTATEEGVSFICAATGDYSNLTLTNTGSATATAEILAVYDYGTKQNPEIVAAGSHTLTLQDSNAGWEYLFNATESGVVKFTVHSATNGWQYNLEASVDRFSDDASPLATQYMSVAAGESMTIFLGTWSGDAAYRPAGEISWSIEYVDGMGTQENPAPYEGSMEYATITTGKIPAGGLVWFKLPASSAGRGLTISDPSAYAIQGETRYDYSEYFGCVTVDRLLPNANGDYIVGIGNDGAAAKSFQLFAGDALGSIDNPASFDLSESNGFTRTITVELSDGAPIYYQMSTETEGTLTVTIDSATNGWQMQLAMPYGGAAGTLVSSANGDEPTTSLAVPAWDAVRLMLATEDGKAGTITFTAAYGDGTTPPDVPEVTEGTKENPIQNYGEFPIVTPVIAAGETLYYAVYRAEGTVLTWEDADATLKVNGLNFASGSVLTAGPNGYTEVAVTNNASAAKSFTLNVDFALGHPSNPAQLQLGENTAVLAANNWEGYNYTWTAPADGTLVTTMVDGLWVYTINNLTTGVYGEMCYNDTHEAVCETAVSEGDLIQVIIGSFDPADYSSPAANIVFTAEFRGPAGTDSNPIPWTGEPPIVTAEIPAGESLYYSVRVMSGMLITCGDQDASFTIDGAEYTGGPISAGRAPIVIGVTNNASVAKRFTVDINFPLGHMDNPDQLTLGENTATVAANVETGYNYIWTAPAAGRFTVTMTGETWQYCLSNSTSFVTGSVHLSDDETVVSSETIEVSAGDEIALMVNTYVSADSWDTPAGDVTFIAAFDPQGSYTNPIIWVGEPPIVTGVIPAGETLYYSAARASGMVMSCADPDAVLTLNQQAYDGAPIVSDFFAPSVIGITNSGSEDKSFSIALSFPLGHPENPAELVLGENIAHVPADSWDGYNFTWTATDDGTLVTTMAEGLWIYTVNNLTSGIYGNQCFNDTDEPVWETAVSKGDQIQVIIGTFDPVNNSSPAADIVFTAEFLGVPGSYSNPIAWAGEPPLVTAEIAPGATVYYSLTKASGMTMSCQDPDAALTLNGNAYDGQLLECSSWNPAIVGITNNGGKAKSFTVDLTFPLGHPENPDKLALGENVAHVPADSWDGYNFTWTATANGQLTLTMTGNLWVYTVNNLTSGEYGNMCYNDTDEPVCHVNVSKGDEIQVIIGTFNAEDYSAPAADILFTASFQKVSSISAKQETTTLTYGQPSSKGLQVGDSVKINVFGADKKVPLGNVSFAITSGADYAELTEDGIVTAAVAGKTVKVKATWTAGKTTKSATVSIKTKAMLPGTLTIDAGAAWDHENGYLITDGVNEEGKLMVLSSDAAKTFQLAVSSANCIGEPLEEAASVTWSTSSSKLATVSKTGLVTIKKGVSGTVTITAKSKLNSACKATLTIEIVDYTPEVAKSVTANSYLSAPACVDIEANAADPVVNVQFEATKGDMTGIAVELENGQVVVKTDAILKNGTRKGTITLTTEHGHTNTVSFSVKISNKAPTVTIKTTRKLNTKDIASYAELTVTAKLGKEVMEAADITLDSLSFEKAATDAAGVFKLTRNNGDAKLDKSGKVTVQVAGCRYDVTKSVTVGTESVANKAVLSQKTVTLSKSNAEQAEALVNVDAYFVGQTVTVASCTTTSAQGKKLAVEINGDEIKISLADGSDIKTGTYSFTVKTLDQDGNPLKNVTLKVKVTK